MENIVVVSICCVTFNHENYIRQCLDGFVMQKTNFAFEILVHDDASTDNTASIVKEYEAKYSHLFRCVYQTENQFAKQNTLINILFKMARGNYIAICEGDDYWTDPYKLQKQVDFLEENRGVTLCSHKSSIVNEIDGTTHKTTPSERTEDATLTTKDIIDYWYMPTASYVFRRSALNIHEFSRLTEGLMFGDLALVYYLSWKGNIFYSDTVMSVYRHNKNGITATHGERESEIYLTRLNEHQIIFMKRFNELTNLQHNRQLAKIISLKMLNLSDLYYVQKEYKKAIKTLKDCFLFNSKIVFYRPRIFFAILIVSLLHYLK